MLQTSSPICYVIVSLTHSPLFSNTRCQCVSSVRTRVCVLSPQERGSKDKNRLQESLCVIHGAKDRHFAHTFAVEKENQSSSPPGSASRLASVRPQPKFPFRRDSIPFSRTARFLWDPLPPTYRRTAIVGDPFSVSRCSLLLRLPPPLLFRIRRKKNLERSSRIFFLSLPLSGCCMEKFSFFSREEGGGKEKKKI
jgi:hypothetical protein